MYRQVEIKYPELAPAQGRNGYFHIKLIMINRFQGAETTRIELLSQRHGIRAPIYIELHDDDLLELISALQYVVRETPR